MNNLEEFQKIDALKIKIREDLFTRVTEANGVIRTAHKRLGKNFPIPQLVRWNAFISEYNKATGRRREFEPAYADAIVNELEKLASELDFFYAKKKEVLKP